MQGLRVLGIAGEIIHAIESAIRWVIVSSAEVILLGGGVELFAGVEQVRSGGSGGSRIAAQHHAVGIVGVGIDDVNVAGD